MKLNKSDFVSVDCKVIMQNTTSRTELYDPTKIAIEEVFETGCILRMPPRTCAAGHMLLIGFFTGKLKVNPDLLNLEGDLPEGFFKVIGKVVDAKIEKTTGEFSISLQFQQQDDKRWRNICRGFSDRQDGVTDLLKKVSGT